MSKISAHVKFIAFHPKYTHNSDNIDSDGNNVKTIRENNEQ
jgi:hypothetical protein